MRRALSAPHRAMHAFGERTGIGGGFLSNLSYMAVSQMAIRVSRLATVVVLTRLLSPSDYGAAAMVLTVNELLAVFTRNGVSSKVVQVDDARLQSTALACYWLTWVVCVALLVGQVALAHPAAAFLGHPELALPIAAMAVVYLVNPFCNVQSAMMQREGRLGRMAAASTIQVVADNVLSAVFALCGMGFWSIVLPKILVAPIWLHINRSGHPWRPSGMPTFRGAREILRYSRGFLGVEIMNVLQGNMDTFLVGVFLGVQALGIYSFAFNAGLGITMGLVNSMAIAVFPHLCEARDDPVRLRQRYVGSLKTVGAAVVPLVLVQTLLAPFYVPVVFGSKWNAAIPVLMLISLSALPRPFANGTSQLLRATGRADTDFAWQAAMTAVLFVAVICGLPFGIAGVATAVLATQIAVSGAFSFSASRSVFRTASAVRA